MTRSVLLEAGLDHALAVEDLAERDVRHLDGVVVADQQHELLRLLGADGGIGHGERFVARRARHADAREHARREDAIVVIEHGAAADRARGAIDHVVDEVHPALVNEVVLVEQLERDRRTALAPGHVAAVLGEALVTQIRGLVEGEFEADRVHRNDHRKQRGIAGGVAGDEIAARHPAVADPAGDRGLELGEFEVEQRLPHRGGQRIHHRLGDALGLGALVERLLGDGAFLDELGAAGEIGLGEGEIGLRLGQIAPRLVERGLERALVDGEQEVALLDHLAVGEMDGVEIS